MGMPRRVEALERLTQVAHANWFALATTAPWSKIIEPGWFDRFSEWGIRAKDRIEVTASYYSDTPEIGTLFVVSNESGEVKVKTLVRMTPVDASL